LQNSAVFVVFCKSGSDSVVIPVDVSSPISSVIPSLDGAVLDALAGTTAPLNLSAVHKLAGRGSMSGVRRVLLRLVRRASSSTSQGDMSSTGTTWPRLQLNGCRTFGVSCSIE
jgi:hypothetical protein